MTLERSTGVVNVSGVGHAGGVPVAAQFEPSNCQLTLTAVGGAVVAPPERAIPLYERFVELLEGLGVPVAGGVFGAHMAVEIHNDGPVTVIVESP